MDPLISANAIHPLVYKELTPLFVFKVSKQSERLYLHPPGRRGGDGLYLYKSGHCVKVEPTNGKGLRLTPNRLIGVHRDGMHLKRGSQLYDGRGLLLGRNSYFKNIPILNLLL